MALRSDMGGSRVLVSGLTGFTGQYVARALVGRGHEVYGLSGMSGESIDLLDGAAVRECVQRVRPHAVIHLAAISFVAHEDVAGIYSTNIVGTRNLLEALAGLNQLPRSVLLASSANVYGNAAELPIRESTPLAPVNDYAVSKVAMELMAKNWSERLPLTIVRPFNYTGVGQSSRFLIPKIVEHFQQKKPRILLGNTDVARDFSDVRVVADVYARLIDLSVAGQTFNVCSSTAMALAEVIELLSRISGHAIEVDVDPKLVRANEIKTLYGSPQRLREAIPDYAPVPMERLLRWMYEAA